MERRIKASDLKPGMVLLRSPKRVFNATVESVTPLAAGHSVKGPRGGTYEVTAAGAGTFVSVRAGSQCPVFDLNLPVTILVEDEF